MKGCGVLRHRFNCSPGSVFPLSLFKLKDDGHYAEALMTKGVLAPRGSMEQLKVRYDWSKASIPILF